MSKLMYADEFEKIVIKTALDIMMQPQKLFLGEQVSKVEGLAQLNDRISQYNDGIRALSAVLVSRLHTEEES